MSSRLFFYIGARLLGEGVGDTGPDWYFGPAGADFYEGFEAASTFFAESLQPSGEDWFYLVEYTPRSKLIELGNMCFRLFAPWKSGGKEMDWLPPGKTAWDPPDHLGQPLRITANLKAWEFLSSSISMTANPALPSKDFDVARTGRANFTALKTNKKFVLKGDVPAVEDCSGKVLQTEFDAFIDVLKPQLPYPLMSVSDCNTFHTTGYLWG